LRSPLSEQKYYIDQYIANFNGEKSSEIIAPYDLFFTPGFLSVKASEPAPLLHFSPFSIRQEPSILTDRKYAETLVPWAF
jgi:hypothetical protein